MTVPSLDQTAAVAQDARTGRWFITIGHAGFNSTANNRHGYSSAAVALAAHHRHLEAGAKARRLQEALDDVAPFFSEPLRHRDGLVEFH